jgi:hypothetical protein
MRVNEWGGRSCVARASHFLVKDSKFNGTSESISGPGSLSKSQISSGKPLKSGQNRDEVTACGHRTGHSRLRDRPGLGCLVKVATSCRRSNLGQRVNWTAHSAAANLQYMSVDHGRGHVGMAEQFLHSTDVVAGLQHSCRKRMAKVMWRCRTTNSISASPGRCQSTTSHRRSFWGDSGSQARPTAAALEQKLDRLLLAQAVQKRRTSRFQLNVAS